MYYQSTPGDQIEVSNTTGGGIDPPSDVLIRDIGMLVPIATTLTFTDASNIKDLRGSDNIRTLMTDGGLSDPSITLLYQGVSQQSGGTNFLDKFKSFDRTTSATSSSTTTSSTYVLMNSMSISGSVLAGTYLMIFTATLGNSGAGNSVFVELYNNTTGTPVAFSGSERFVSTLTNNYRVVMEIAHIGVLTATSTNVVEVRWRRSAGTATVINRHLTIYRIGD